MSLSLHCVWHIGVIKLKHYSIVYLNCDVSLGIDISIGIVSWVNVLVLGSPQSKPHWYPSPLPASPCLQALQGQASLLRACG